MTITCGYDDKKDKIIIKSNQGEKQVELINNLQYFTDNFTVVDYKEGSKGGFINSQKIIRYLDCLKDLGFTKKDMFPIFVNTESVSKLNKEFLNKIEKAFTKKNIDDGFITYKSWLRETDISQIEDKKKFDIKYIFYEMGLDPLNYIKHSKNNGKKPTPTKDSFPTYVRNVANEIIDPFTRSFQLERQNIVFERDEKIIMDKSFFNFFGFNDSVSNYDYIYSKSKSKYDYNIDFSFSGQTVKLSNKDNQEFLKGNAVKKVFLTNTQETKKTNKKNEDAKKQAFIVTKELGDVSQVLLMYIYCKYKNIGLEDYTMISEDMVVYLFCQMLKQSCIFPEYVEKVVDKSQLKNWLPEIINSGDKVTFSDKTQIRKIHCYLPIDARTPEQIAQITKAKSEKFIKDLRDEVETYNNIHIQMLLNLIDERKRHFYLDSKIIMNENHILLIKYLIAKIQQKNVELSNITNNGDENTMKNSINRCKVPLIFKKGSDEKINHSVRIEDTNYDYAIEMQGIWKMNRGISEKFKFGMADIEGNITQNKKEEIEYIDEKIDEYIEQPVVNDGIFSKLYNLVRHKNSMLSYLYNLIYPVRTGGKTRKNRKKQGGSSLKSNRGNNSPIPFNPFEKDIKEEFFKEDFTSSEYGYSILDEFFQINIIQQVYNLYKSNATDANLIKNFVELLNTTTDKVPTENHIKLLFEELYTFLSREFYERGEVFYDEQLLGEIKKFIQGVIPDREKTIKPKPLILKPQSQRMLQSQTPEIKPQLQGMSHTPSQGNVTQKIRSNSQNRQNTQFTRKRKPGINLNDAFSEEYIQPFKRTRIIN